MSKPQQAIVLAGGKGTRLNEITDSTPKSLLEVRGRPFIEHIFNQLERLGVTDIIVAGGYLGEQLMQAYDGKEWGNSDIRCFFEDETTGTGGALMKIETELEDTFYVLNGDSILKRPWTGLSDNFNVEGAIASMALVEVQDASRYGSVVTDEADFITEFGEKDGSVQGPAWVNAGVYALDKEAIENFFGVSPMSLEYDVFPTLASDGALAGLKCEGPFIDIGIPEDLERARNSDWIENSYG